MQTLGSMNLHKVFKKVLYYPFKVRVFIKKGSCVIYYSVILQECDGPHGFFQCPIKKSVINSFDFCLSGVAPITVMPGDKGEIIFLTVFK